MKVFNLACEHGHEFEGWFSSTQDYHDQADGELLRCPLCDSAGVKRMPSAPRLNLGADSGAVQPVSTDPSEQQAVAAPTAAQIQSMWLKMVRHVQANTEDVGDKFAEEARRIHYKETPERGIRGVATIEEANDLSEEGIDVMALPMPAAAKDTLQ